MTNASPFSGGTHLKNCSRASTPPAEAPMPTIGRLGIMMLFRLSHAEIYLTPRPHPFKRMFRAPVPNRISGRPRERRAVRRSLRRGAKVRSRMARRRSPPDPRLGDLLEKVRGLAQDVRETS